MDQKNEEAMKEVDFKLKGMDKDNDTHLKVLEEFEKIKESEFEDLAKNPEIIRKVRDLKSNIDTSDVKLKEIEEV